ncbi:MAG: branched-chain-amino-acid transaminase [Methanobrevibacter sp.]|jgi:branched-chain amino acid aminotransferase|nr:branched-chain-amino-acid transaminase [Candidatus Methanovirga procula]
MIMDENGKIWMDGKFVNWNDANIHILSHVIHYGSSVFEGIRAYDIDGNVGIFRLKEHVQRLFESMKIYRMNISYTPEEISDVIKETIAINNLKKCYIRPVVYRGYGTFGVDPQKLPVNIAIAVWSWGQYLGDNAVEKGVDVGVSSWRRLAPNTLPSLAKSGANYMNAQLAKLEASENNLDECIMLDIEGFIGEGSGENIFLIKDNIIYTPAISSSILKGITRDSVITIAKDLGYEVVQEKIPRELLYVADELFYSGTAAEITPIRTVDGIDVGNGKVGSITKSIQSEFFNIIRGKSEDKYQWLDILD